jgi:glycosyltransferase involved in cell wall biosynthesis
MSVGRLIRRRRPGVNVVGYLNHVLGLGESARQFVTSLARAMVPHASAAIDLGDGAPRLPEGSAPWLEAAELPFDLTVLWANPDRYGIDVVPAELPGQRLIGRWAWELTRLPKTWSAEARWFNEIWTASRFVQTAVADAVSVPVRVIPMAVNVMPSRRLERDRWNVRPEHPLFLYMFDYHSVPERKNPEGVIEAFRLAFAERDDVSLLIKTINAATMPAAAERLQAAADAHPGIALRDVAVSDDERRALLGDCQCYVSLHRSEGFGMTIAEAMGYGRPVIATDYGGCTEFLTRRTGFPVPWSPIEVGPNAIYPQDDVWAEPDLEQAARLMRHVVDAPLRARVRGRSAAARIAMRHAPRVVGKQLLRELRRASSSR